MGVTDSTNNKAFAKRKMDEIAKEFNVVEYEETSFDNQVMLKRTGNFNPRQEYGFAVLTKLNELRNQSGRYNETDFAGKINLIVNEARLFGMLMAHRSQFQNLPDTSVLRKYWGRSDDALDRFPLTQNNSHKLLSLKELFLLNRELIELAEKKDKSGMSSSFFIAIESYQQRIQAEIASRSPEHARGKTIEGALVTKLQKDHVLLSQHLAKLEVGSPKRAAAERVLAAIEKDLESIQNYGQRATRSFLELSDLNRDLLALEEHRSLIKIGQTKSADATAAYRKIVQEETRSRKITPDELAKSVLILQLSEELRALNKSDADKLPTVVGAGIELQNMAPEDSAEVDEPGDIVDQAISDIKSQNTPNRDFNAFAKKAREIVNQAREDARKNRDDPKVSQVLVQTSAKAHLQVTFLPKTDEYPKGKSRDAAYRVKVALGQYISNPDGYKLTKAQQKSLIKDCQWLNEKDKAVLTPMLHAIPLQEASTLSKGSLHGMKGQEQSQQLAKEVDSAPSNQSHFW